MISTNLRARPADPVLKVELEEGAFNHGYRKANGEADGWMFFNSDEGVPGEIALASGKFGAEGAWFLAVEHAGVASALSIELSGNSAEPVPAGYMAAFSFVRQEDMRRAISRSFHLARSLPTFPLAQFESEVAALGATEKEALVRQRLGQDRFRKALIDYWGKCPLTGISEPAMLRASHIKPWAQCESDAERLDVFNGLLLSAHWDAAFDAGLVSFSDDGMPIFRSGLEGKLLDLLSAKPVYPLPLTDAHREKLAWHRSLHNFGADTP